MPIYYAGIRQEHVAVREAAGVFDVSHMGQIETSGPGATDLLQHLLSNDVEQMSAGGAQYSVLCTEEGGVLDDLFTYRLQADRYLTVTNAANHERDLEWFAAHAEGFDAELFDRHADYAMLAVQGPLAREIVQAISDAPLPARMTVAERMISGHRALVCGTGYTGEDGVELLLPPDAAPSVWDAVVRRGATPAGLGARDTLRLEACFHLYGNDLSIDRGPIEAGLGWCCKEDTGFIGAAAVRAARERGPAERLVPFRLSDPGIPRSGNPVVGGGVVTSGSMSPMLGVGIGLAYVPAGRAEPDTPIAIDIRGKHRAGVVARKPLYSSRAARTGSAPAPPSPEPQRGEAEP
jgi:aminomethyltransferase